MRPVTDYFFFHIYPEAVHRKVWGSWYNDSSMFYIMHFQEKLRSSGGSSRKNFQWNEQTYLFRYAETQFIIFKYQQINYLCQMVTKAKVKHKIVCFGASLECSS